MYYNSYGDATSHGVSSYPTKKEFLFHLFLKIKKEEQNQERILFALLLCIVLQGKWSWHSHAQLVFVLWFLFFFRIINLLLQSWFLRLGFISRFGFSSSAPIIPFYVLSYVNFLNPCLNPRDSFQIFRQSNHMNQIDSDVSNGTKPHLLLLLISLWSVWCNT